MVSRSRNLATFPALPMVCQETTRMAIPPGAFKPSTWCFGGPCWLLHRSARTRRLRVASCSPSILVMQAASYGDCGGSACGPYTVDLSNEFPPTGVSITDTIAFCPYETFGFAPIGNCASSFSNQCSGTLNVFIDGIAPPATASDGGNSNDGGNNGSNDAGGNSGNDAGGNGGNDAGNGCLADNAACTRGGLSTCCSQYCSCSNQCTTRPVNPVICPGV